MSSDTRRNILEAAHDLIVGDRNPAASMGSIASAAGVSRQAIYLHFDSRSDLLLGLVDFIDEQLDVAGRFSDLADLEDSRARLMKFLDACMRLEPDLFDATIVFDVARHTDEAIADAFDDRMQRRRRGHLRQWRLVAEAGNLRADYTPERAAQATWAMTTPSAYRTFVVEAGWELDDWIAFVTEVVKELMIDP